MCIIEVKTYIHADGRREIIESKNLCHNAVGNSPCAYVRTRNVDARVVETRPSSRGGSQSDDMIVVGRDGRERRYHPLTRTTSHRTPASTRDSKRTTQSPVDSVSSPTTSVPRSYRTAEVRPSSAKGSPPSSTALPSARYNGPSGGFSPTTKPVDPYRIIKPDGTASYARPPSLERQRTNVDPNPFSTRQPAATTEFGPPLRKPSIRVTKPTRVTFDPSGGSSVASSSGTSSFSDFRSPPDLGHSRNDSANDLFAPRADSFRADEDLARRLQQEEDRQAEIERQRLDASGRRRRDSFAVAEDDARRTRLDESERRERNRLSKQAEEAARQRAAENQRSREASRERTERKRREAQEALEGKRKAERREKDFQERADAELAQMAQERENAAARQRDSVERYQESRSGPTTTRTTYTYASGSSPTVSTRSPTGSARQQTAVIHNYSSTRRNSALLERGDAVIERERRRVAGEMTDAMAEMSLDAAYDKDAIVDADARYSASQRARRERREAERRDKQRREEQRRYDEGFF